MDTVDMAMIALLLFSMVLGPFLIALNFLKG